MKTLLLLAALAAAGLAAPTPVEPSATWQGSVDDPAAKPGATRVITDAKALQALWKAWKIDGEVPAIDFGESLVIAETTSGSRLRLVARLSEDGNLQALGMATRDLRPGFRYVLGQFELEGIKTVNGEALGGPTLTGTITCAAGGAVPEGATITVRLNDVSRADAAATPLAETSLKGPAAFPIDYALNFDPKKLRLENPLFHSLSVRIESKGKLLFINDTHIPVSEEGQLRADVEIPVIPVR
jgi:uncharacterized lipoprotein YbaY